MVHHEDRPQQSEDTRLNNQDVDFFEAVRSRLSDGPIADQLDQVLLNATIGQSNNPLRLSYLERKVMGILVNDRPRSTAELIGRINAASTPMWNTIIELATRRLIEPHTKQPEFIWAEHTVPGTADLSAWLNEHRGTDTGYHLGLRATTLGRDIYWRDDGRRWIEEHRALFKGFRDAVRRWRDSLTSKECP